MLLKSFAPHDGAINCIRWNHNNQVLATCGDDGIIVLSRHNGQHLGKIPATAPDFEPACLNCMSFSSTSRYLCVGSADGVITVWDLKETKPASTLHSRARSAVTSVIFNADNTQIISGDESGAILHHSIASRRMLGSLLREGDSATMGVVHMRFSPHVKNLLASSYVDGSVVLWDLKSKKLKFEFHRAHMGGVATSVFFSPLNTALFGSAGSDGLVRLYDATSGNKIHQIRVGTAITAADLLPDGQTLVTGTADGRLRVDDLKNQTNSWVATGAGKAINWIAPQSGAVGAATATRTRKKNLSDRKTKAAAVSPPRDRQRRDADSAGKAHLSVSTSKGHTQKSPASLVDSRRALATSPIHTSSSPVKTAATSTPSSQVSSSLAAIDSAYPNSKTPQPSLEDFKNMTQNIQEIIREDLRDLHLEMLRQFAQQQTQMEQALSLFSDKMKDLVEENIRLRKENEHLKHVH